jgi:hypothetical protein
MNGRSRGYWGIKILEIANAFAVQEDVDVGAEFAGFVANVKFEPRIIAVERMDDFTNGAAGNHYRFAVANCFA